MTKPLSLLDLESEIREHLRDKTIADTFNQQKKWQHKMRILETARMALKVVEAAKAFTKEWWFKPGPDTGCCGLCDGNLLPLLKGKHGNDCHADLVHKALAPFRNEITERREDKGA